MHKSLTLTMVFSMLLFLPSIEAQTQIYKCKINGTIAYQNVPCPVGAPAKRPTVEQLNAERTKRLQEASAPSTNAPARPNPARARSPAITFHCDGRTYCSQMTSCTEAKNFLAHCPGVKMDGNHDAIPCERQWCSN